MEVTGSRVIPALQMEAEAREGEGARPPSCRSSHRAEMGLGIA